LARASLKFFWSNPKKKAILLVKPLKQGTAHSSNREGNGSFDFQLENTEEARKDINRKISFKN